MANRRLVFSYLQNKEAVKELFGVVAEKVADRPGGYLRILKTGYRLGDNAEMCMIELVDFNEAALEAASVKKEKTTRRSRRKKSTTNNAEAAAPKKEEAPKAEAPAEATEPKAEEKTAEEGEK